MIPCFCAFLFAPIWSFISDSFHIQNEVLLGTLAFSSFATMLMYVFNSFEMQLAVVGLLSVLRSPVSPLIDALVMSSLVAGTDYGGYRLWGAIGFGVFSLLGGLLSSAASGQERTKESFMSIFVLHGCCAVAASLVILSIITKKALAARALAVSDSKNTSTALDVSTRSTVALALEAGRAFDDEFESSAGGKSDVSATACTSSSSSSPSNPAGDAGKNKKNVMGDVMHVLRMQPSVFVFSIVVLLSGFGTGVIESFLFIRLRQLGGSGTVMGISRFITCVAEVPMFQVAGWLESKIGIWRLVRLRLHNVFF